ncbi:MAG TPA: hypothetical protein PKN62_01890 [bacterium]|nr:hypothetical protein [bacterium]
MTVSAQELISTNCQKTKVPKNIKWTWRRFNRFLWATMCLSALSYLMVANSLATQSFLLKDQKNELASLRQKQADLQNQVTLYSSYEHLQGKVRDLGMVSVDRLSYAVTDNEVLAKK